MKLTKHSNAQRYGMSVRKLLSSGLLLLSPLLGLAQPYTNDVISREVSVFNFGGDSAQVETISREVSVFVSPFYTFDNISREVSVLNYGPNRLDLTIGSTALRAGDTSGVPITLYSLAPVTNLQFAFDFPSNLLVNWSAQLIQSTSGSASNNSSRVYVSFTPADVQSYFKTQVLGQVSFVAIPDQPSAFLLLTSVDANGQRADEPDSPIKTFHNGEVVVIRTNSLLRMSRNTNGLEYLTLYGFSGTNYAIESATNLTPPIDWKPVYGLTPVNLIANTPDFALTNLAEFFRAKQ